MKEQLLDAWRISNGMMLLFIDNIDDDAMQLTLSPRGRNIYQQLAHAHSVRLQWLEIVAKELLKDQKHVEKEKLDRKALRTGFEASSKAIEKFIEISWENGGKVKSFKTGLIPFISYILAHEAHHRGSALLTIKQSGIKIPEALKWGLWEWGK